jgi:hypothetical protein
MREQAGTAGKLSILSPKFPRNFQALKKSTDCAAAVILLTLTSMGELNWRLSRETIIEMLIVIPRRWK